jgi:hypothetical protein
MPHLERILDSRIAAVAVVIFAGLAKAQSPPSRPQFEAASIKPDSSGGQSAMLKPFLGGRLTVENFSLRMLLEFAYQVTPFPETNYRCLCAISIKSMIPVETAQQSNLSILAANY